MRLLALSASIGLAFLAQLGQQRPVTIRLVNAKTGQPFILKTRNLEVTSYDSMPSVNNRSMNKVAPDFRVLERPDGTAALQLSRSVPPVICLHPDFPFPYYTVDCGHFCFWTRDVLRRGVVSENQCDPKGKLKKKFIPKPGEIILFVRRHTFWDTL